MGKKTKHTPGLWLWPDKTIEKRESHQLREEHNKLVDSHNKLLDALQTCETLFSGIENIICAAIAKATREQP